MPKRNRRRTTNKRDNRFDMFTGSSDFSISTVNVTINNNNNYQVGSFASGYATGTLTAGLFTSPVRRGRASNSKERRTSPISDFSQGGTWGKPRMFRSPIKTTPPAQPQRPWEHRDQHTTTLFKPQQQDYFQVLRRERIVKSLYIVPVDFHRNGYHFCASVPFKLVPLCFKLQLLFPLPNLLITSSIGVLGVYSVTFNAPPVRFALLVGLMVAEESWDGAIHSAGASFPRSTRNEAFQFVSRLIIPRLYVCVSGSEDVPLPDFRARDSYSKIQKSDVERVGEDSKNSSVDDVRVEIVDEKKCIGHGVASPGSYHELEPAALNVRIPALISATPFSTPRSINRQAEDTDHHEGALDA
ncbi:hypothetical protein FA13DRAFT_1777833 [Coprinellus micaceus]|uniref:Uncharacterized protein n=1 Tax=Coprinellus micaceus TaxID=71717 RepID=A0A4Y7SRH8_COPMI|nr:hypothetical protein FA13DRAFT_1777833 [Coprinellus micaceus]